MLLFTVFYLLRYSARLAVFPGSVWFWLKELEFQFCHEYCASLTSVTGEVLSFLVSLPDPDSPTAPYLHLDKFDLEIVIEQVS